MLPQAGLEVSENMWCGRVHGMTVELGAVSAAVSRVANTREGRLQYAPRGHNASALCFCLILEKALMI